MPDLPKNVTINISAQTHGSWHSHVPHTGDMQWRRADGTMGTYHGPLKSLGHGIPRPMRDHGFRRALFDLAYGYTSGFPVRDILPFALRSLFRQRLNSAYTVMGPAEPPTSLMNQSTAAYLATFGIDAMRMPLNGWDSHGYVVFDGPGPVGDSSRPVHYSWPDGFDYAHLLTLWAQDEPSRRAMGVSV